MGIAYTHRRCAVIVILCLTAVSTTAAQYSGGSGTAADPYRIATPADLIVLGETSGDHDKHFILTANINLDPNLDGGKIFDHAAIGAFSGVLDGNSHTISHLTIRGGSDLGLFSALSGQVMNLGVVDVNIVGSGGNIGGLAGSGGRMVQCYSTGTVVGGHECVGGLVGWNGGPVTRCYSTAAVNGSEYVGGLVGYDVSNRGVTDCYAAGRVTGGNGDQRMGGLTGWGARPTRSYFLHQEDGGGPDNGYGTVLRTAQMGRQSSFEGWDFYGSDADGTEDAWSMSQGSYPVLSWQTEITGLRQVPDVTGLTVEQARSRLEDAGFAVGDIQYVHAKGVARSGVTSTDPAASRYRPLGDTVDIVFDVGPYDWARNPGDGSQANPYQIQTVRQIDALHERPDLWSKSFVLTADIDLQGAIYVGYVVAGRLTGNFDGDGHRIMNVVIEVSAPTDSSGSRSRTGVSAAPLGFFGTVDSGARITGLAIENVEIPYSGNTAGLLASANIGTIVDCSTSGTVKNANTAGGLVGDNQGRIANCRSSASVSAAEAGGLVGANGGTIADGRASGPVTVGMPGTYSHAGGGLVAINRGVLLRSCATGAVAGAVGRSFNTDGAGVGGLVGMNAGGITFCFATGSVQGAALLGGLAGANRGSITDSYATGSIAGRDGLGGLAGTNFDYHVDWAKDQWGWPIQVLDYSPGTITRCYSTGPVTFDSAYPPGQYAGALVGQNSVTWERTTVGGKVQYKCDGTISDNSYFLAPPDGNAPVNGLGTPLTFIKMTEQGSFSNWAFCRNASDSPADAWFMPQGSPPVLSWQTDLTGLQVIPDVKGMTEAQADRAIEDAGFLPAGVRYAYDPTMPLGVAIATDPPLYARPGDAVEIVLNAPYDWTTNPGDGTEERPFQIETRGQLETLGDSPDLWGRHFVLTQDIDMSGRACAGALIGRRPAASTDSSTEGADQTACDSATWEAFTGTFDGQGHAISNLAIVVDPSAGCPASGLFSSIGETGQVRSLRLERAVVDANSGDPESLGLLAGSSRGVISRCGVTGTANGRVRYLGGLVGLNRGTLEQCYADVRVWSLCNMGAGGVAGDVGGLAGRNEVAGAIRDCFAIGRVRGCEAYIYPFDLSAGGLVGRDLAMGLDAHAIERCYSACSVVGTNAGGLIGAGYNYFGEGYYAGFGGLDGAAPRYSPSGFFLSPSDGGECDNGLGKPLSAIQMRQQSSFPGWDFVDGAADGDEDIWWIPEGRDYPRLSWEVRDR